MPRTVYAVSSGDYSDYIVHFLFVTETDAQRHAEQRRLGDRHEESRVEEFTLFDEGESPARIGRHSAWISLTGDGEIAHEDEHFDVEWGHSAADALTRPRVTVRGSYAYGGRYMIRAEAASRDAAWKAARDRAAKMKAELVEHADLTPPDQTSR